MPPDAPAEAKVDLALSPEFSPNTYMYTADLAGLALETLSIEGVKIVASSTVTYLSVGQQVINPQQGDLFVIQVAQGTKISTYIVQLFNSMIAPLPQAELIGITLSVGTINFSQNIYQYTVDVPYRTQNVLVSALTQNNTYYVSYNSPSGAIVDLATQDTITINVISPATSIGAYTISFVVGASSPSALTGISVSAGSLVTAAGNVVGKDAVFDPDTEAYTIKIPKNTYTSIAVTGIADHHDSVSYKQGDVKNNVISGAMNTLHGKKIELIVNADDDGSRRPGSTSRTYELSVAEVDPEPAKLSNITVSGIANPKLLRWQDGAVTANEGFDENCSTYTLQVPQAATITITGEVAASELSVQYGGSNAAITPKPSDGPLQIFASGDIFYTDTSYTVFFAYSNPPDALLTTLSIPVGTLTAPAMIADPQQSNAQVPAPGAYTAHIPYGTQVFGVNKTAPAAYQVIADPPFLSFPSSGEIITLTVNGGPDLKPASYIITVDVAEPKNPHLASLRVGADDAAHAVALNSNVLSYQVTFSDAAAGAVDVPFIWAVNDDTDSSSYSFDDGSSWKADAGKDGFSQADGTQNSISLAACATKRVLIRLVATDGTAIIYHINVTRLGSSDASLLALPISAASGGTLTLNPAFGSSKFSYTIISSGKSLSLTGAPSISAAASVHYQLNGGVWTTPAETTITLAGATAQTLVVRVTPQDASAPNVYTFVITWAGYLINFEKYGATGGDACGTMYATGTTLGVLPTPTKTHSTFDGWYTAATGGTRVTGSYEPSGNMTLHARWLTATYTITFMKNDGTPTEIASETVTFPGTVGTLPSMGTRVGYISDGKWWTGEEDGTEFTSSTPVTASISVYPHWAADTVSLSGFSAKFNSYTAAAPSRSGDTYTITVPTFTDYVAVTAAQATGALNTTPSVVISAAQTAWATQTVGDTKNITITVTPASGYTTNRKVYTVTFVKADKKMATGGTVGYVKTGSDGTATFDEVHSFTTAGAGQNLTFVENNPNVSAQILLVAGGGGGGGAQYPAGGGGAGGMVEGSNYLLSQDSYSITVGAGGAGGTGGAGSSGNTGSNGSVSKFGSIEAKGGGGGAGREAKTNVRNGNNGGSGGGSTWAGTVGTVLSNSTLPSGFVSYGNSGGAGSDSPGIGNAAGGGGGAGGAGISFPAVDGTSGGGGAGRSNSISGTSTTYASGGGTSSSVDGTKPSTPTMKGSGGRGGWNGAGGNGSNGIVIVRFPWAAQ